MAMKRCGGGQGCFLLAWNGFVLAMGVALIVVGVWIYMDRDSGKFEDGVAGSTPSGDDPVTQRPVVVVQYRSVSNSDGVFSVLPFSFMVMGSCTVIFTFVAFAGSVCRNRILLGACFALQLLVFIASIGVAVYLYLEKDSIDVDEGKLSPLISEAVLGAVNSYHNDHQAREFMDVIQKKYKCCGASNGAGDYAPVLSLPCEYLHSTSPCVEPYQKGLLSNLGLKEFFRKKIDTGFALAAAHAAILIVLQILTLFVCCSIDRSD